jgi:type II secretory ATPase GspE/PulE/Tfp pilus assembly ATPase PilB-like protein
MYPLLQQPTLEEFAKFCLHSNDRNMLRWFSFYTELSDVYLTEALAKDFDLLMLPEEKLLVMPRAADLFRSWVGNEPTGWVPLFTSGAFIWVANYDPLEPLPASIPAILVKKCLVSSSSYDELVSFWATIKPLDVKVATGEMPASDAERVTWLQNMGLSPHEVHQAISSIGSKVVAFPLREMRLKLLPLGLSFDYWFNLRLFPFYRCQNTVFVCAARELTSEDTIRLSKDLMFKLSLSVVFVPVIRAEILSELKQFEPQEEKPEAGLAPDLLPTEYLDALLEKVIPARVSDIHFEPRPGENTYRIRCRWNGVLYTEGFLPMEKAKPVLNMIKIKASLDVLEVKLPRDGSFGFSSGGKSYDLRVSLIPEYDGFERIVLRILDGSKVPSSLEGLGFVTSDIQIVRRVLELDHGLYLVCGPTGAGKSTTLYASAKMLRLEDYSLQTVEDPVEYKLPGCAQYNVNKAIDLTYDKLLKHILRADPDYILVGEIRDSETARLACVAANTGHLVLSTLHANDSVSAIARLKDLGVPQLLLLDVLKLIVAQRLLRRICTKCRFEQALTALERTNFLEHGYPEDSLPAVVNRARGCKACNFQGYSSRFVVAELLPFDEDLLALIKNGGSGEELKDHLSKAGFRSLYRSALSYVLRGETSFAEVNSLSMA